GGFNTVLLGNHGDQRTRQIVSQADGSGGGWHESSRRGDLVYGVFQRPWRPVRANLFDVRTKERDYFELQSIQRRRSPQREPLPELYGDQDYLSPSECYGGTGN